MLPDPAYRLADRQHAVIARHQLRRWLRDDQIDHRLRPGRELRRLERGCYVLRGSGRRPEHAAFAAALRARPDATVTGPVVLGLLGLDGFIRSDLFEILTSPGRRLRGVDFPHRHDEHPGRPVSVYGEVRCVGPLDALVSSANFLDVLGERRLRSAYDQLRWSGSVRPGLMLRRLRELDGPRTGARQLRELLELDGPEPESEGERLLGRVLRGFVPAPESQVWVTPSRRVDWYFRRVRFAYEYLGATDHAGAENRRRDDARNDELRDQGIRVGYVTAADLDDPEALVATVAGRLAMRADELGLRAPVLDRTPER